MRGGNARENEVRSGTAAERAQRDAVVVSDTHLATFAGPRALVGLQTQVSSETLRSLRIRRMR
jgi:hypothetical protein